MVAIRRLLGLALISLVTLSLGARAEDMSPPAMDAGAAAANYVIGPGDQLQIFVWKNPDLSVAVPVRPDGKISTPLAADIQAQGKTPSELAEALREVLSKYVKDPVVSVLVKNFEAPGSAAAIRVIGDGVKSKMVPYHAGITALDVIIDVGGLETFADGNAAKLIRVQGGKTVSYPLHLSDLINSGDVSQNRVLMPGDIISIPERWF
ncbi:MAG TPA: XrtA/PEP-CTERM system exopolysaccharide export protein [Rhizomicrobium sp.]|nr:XrtA/PEP-CTERM system exopolysaccharide export protein [Rhizomicrobium sp.]